MKEKSQINLGLLALPRQGRLQHIFSSELYLALVARHGGKQMGRGRVCEVGWGARNTKEHILAMDPTYLDNRTREEWFRSIPPGSGTERHFLDVMIHGVEFHSTTKTIH